MFWCGSGREVGIELALSGCGIGLERLGSIRATLGGISVGLLGMGGRVWLD
jgi:hypothetical protein